MEDVERRKAAREYSILALQLRNAGHRAAAASVARRAVRIAPTYAEVVSQYSTILLSVHQPELAIAYAERAIELDPNISGSTAHSLGLAQLYLGNPQRALDEYSRADESLVRSCDLSHILLSMGQWKEGFDAMEFRRLRKPELYKPKKCREWDGEEVDTLWVTTEQGMGDVFHFSRFIPWAATKCRHLIFSTHHQTLPMFQDYPGTNEIRLHNRLMPEPRADAHVPLASLARLYGATPTNIPPDPGHFKTISATIDAQLSHAPGTRKIGIVWAGSSTHVRDWERSIPLEAFLPLVENPALQLFSLQVGPRQSDIEACGLSQVIANLADTLVAWPITASVLSNLDALVTCDTSVAHLAGALDVPTYLLICKLPEWRWLLHRTDTPWYPSVKLVRQTILGDWKQPMENVARALETEL